MWFGREEISTELILLRHGETASNAAHVYCGRLNPPLTPTGEAQARLTRERLEGEFGRVLTSPALRARQTAELICPGTPQVLPELREVDFGAFEGLTADEIQDRFPRDWAEYIADPLRFTFPDGDSMEEYLGRAESTACALVQTEGRVLAVSHKGFISAVLSTLLHGDASRLFHYDVGPAGFAALSVQNGFAVLKQLH